MPDHLYANQLTETTSIKISVNEKNLAKKGVHQIKSKLVFNICYTCIMSQMHKTQIRISERSNFYM